MWFKWSYRLVPSLLSTKRSPCPGEGGSIFIAFRSHCPRAKITRRALRVKYIFRTAKRDNLGPFTKRSLTSSATQSTNSTSLFEAGVSQRSKSTQSESIKNASMEYTDIAIDPEFTARRHEITNKIINSRDLNVSSSGDSGKRHKSTGLQVEGSRDLGLTPVVITLLQWQKSAAHFRSQVRLHLRLEAEVRIEFSGYVKGTSGSPIIII